MAQIGSRLNHIEIQLARQIERNCGVALSQAMSTLERSLDGDRNAIARKNTWIEEMRNTVR